MPDATAELIRDLDDPTKYEVVGDVPVFVAHERDFPEVRDAAGNVVAPARKVRVTDADLPGIADRLNREIRQTGHLRPLTVGHRTFAPGFPEQHQPPLVGFAKADYRVGWVEREGRRFLAVLEREYVMRDRRDVLRQYPYRSIDYDPDMKLSEGTALLLRPPFLKMGTTIIYQYDGATPVPDPTPTPAPDADDFSPEETKAYDRCMRYMARKHPKLRQYMEAVGPANAAAPAPAVPPPPPAPYNATVFPATAAPAAVPVTYAADLAAVNAKLEAERQARVATERRLLEAECRRILDPLVPHRQFDYQRELAALVACADDAGRAAHVKYLADNYLPLPGSGGLVPVYQGTAHMPQPADAGPHKVPAGHDRVVAYMRQNPGMSYEQAEAHFAGK